MQQPRRSLAAARERRTESQRFYRFEDQANDILRSHARHLDTHRRSVMLFYLVFGLIAGFVIGIFGAGSAHATPSAIEPAPAIVAGALLLDPGMADGPLGKQDRFDGLVENPFLLLELADSDPASEPERYAALMWPDHTILFSVIGEGDAIPAPPPFVGKPLFMSMLISIIALSGMLTLIFWTHLGFAHARHRRVALCWPPE